ncbi:MAG TPA: zinc ribbon domain-containing protein [Myxococcota bacterium]
MRSARFWVAALALLCAGFARPQDAPNDVPSGPGTIRGRVVHAQRPESVPGTPVALYALGAAGRSGVRSAEADAQGRFAFEGISNDPHSVYLVAARSGEIPFITRVVFGADELEREIEVALADASDDVSQLSVDAARVQIDRGCGLLRVRQTHTLRNDSRAVIFVPAEARAGHAPLLAVEMPEGATGFESAAGDEGMDFAGRSMRYWGPVYPGEQEVDFSYGVAQAGDLSLAIGMPSGAAEVRILTPLDGVRANGAALEPVAIEAHGEAHALNGHTLGRVAPGEVLNLSLPASASRTSERLKLSEARFVLELDDAALDVHEQYEIRVAGQTPIAADDAEPLLCIPVPERAEGLRFSSSAVELGLTRDPSGALALYGPAPPGESTLAMHYLLPVAGEPVRLEHSFLAPLPRLSVLIADTGVIPTSHRLHPLQPVRTQDRSYLHLEGFSIEAGETVALEMRRLSQESGLRPVGAVVLILIAAAGSLAFLIAPLGGSDRVGLREEPALSPAALEREAVMGSIRDLDEDFETGKVAAEDHRRLRDELRTRAVDLLRVERQGTPSPEPRIAPAGRCPGCDSPARAGDRFCPQCGAALSPLLQADGDTAQ